MNKLTRPIKPTIPMIPAKMYSIHLIPKDIQERRLKFMKLTVATLISAIKIKRDKKKFKTLRPTFFAILSEIILYFSAEQKIRNYQYRQDHSYDPSND